MLNFIDTHSVALAGMVSGFLVGGVFAFCPRFSARLYEPLVPISPTVMRWVGCVGLGWGLWSTVALAVHVWFGFDLMAWGSFGD